MRSGCSLPSTVLLLLLLGLATWSVRHWKPDFICSHASLGWFCGSQAHVADTPSGTKHDEKTSSTPDSDTPSGASRGGSALPWPVADSPRTWSNFREGAYSIPSVADVPKAPQPATAQAIAWPIAEKPVTWSNFREGAYSIPATAPAPAAATAHKTVAHPFPWPIADKPVTWTNVRKPASQKKIVAKNSLSKTVAHPFPWPIADAPRTWTNVRATPTPTTTGIAHPFPWPIADKPRTWTNVRAAPAAELATGVAHPFPWPVADKPRKWTNVRAPAQVAAPKKASDCSAELNRVARAGVILFETSSARLKQSSYATLDELAGVAKSCDQVSITVEGHTDDRGSASFNQRLSEQRAQAVAAYLKGAGVPGGSLQAVGYGESRPAVPNTTSANLAKNRRIEFSASGN